MSHLRDVARRLGGDVVGRSSITMPGPGHRPTDRSLQVTFEGDGSWRVHSHAGDDWRACREHVAALLGDGAFRAPLTDAADRQQKHDWAIRTWHEARDPRGTVVERYLRSRGIPLEEAVANRSLRFHPALRRRGLSPQQGMVALMRNVLTGEPSAVHRTFLTGDGRKIEREAKRMLGPSAGTAIMLQPAGDELVIGEGIETALSARLLGIPHPAWAAGSAGNIARLPVIDGVRVLHILGERDGASEKAASECARRWRAAGRSVRLLLPEPGFKDANDELTKRGPTDA